MEIIQALNGGVARRRIAEFSSLVYMTVTPHLFEAYLKCPTKCFLRSLGKPGAGNTYADWVCVQSTLYLREGISHLTKGVANEEWFTGPLDTERLLSRICGAILVPGVVPSCDRGQFP